MSKPNVCDDCGEDLRLFGPIGSVTLRCGCKADTDFAALLGEVRQVVRQAKRVAAYDLSARGELMWSAISFALDRISKGDLSAEQCAQLARAARGGK